MKTLPTPAKYTASDVEVYPLSKVATLSFNTEAGQIDIRVTQEQAKEIIAELTPWLK